MLKDVKDKSLHFLIWEFLAAHNNFLVACYATLHPTMSVRRSVSRLVGRCPFYFFGVFELFEPTAPNQMP